MADDLGYGRRLSGEEYDRQIVRLHSSLPSMPSKSEDSRIRRMELNLAIDHRLGVDFPEQKREQMWNIMQRVEKRRLWLGLKYTLQSVFSKASSPAGITRKTNALSGYMIHEFGNVLTPKELNSFFELRSDS